MLDVVVTDRSGRPVRNLTKYDFVVREGGELQTVASFEPPGGHSKIAVEKLGTIGSTPEDRSGQTSLMSSALTILVLDELDTRIPDQAYARQEVMKYLRAHGPRLPEATALMVLVERRLELLHDYTDSATELENALRRHPAQLPFRLMTGEGVVGAAERLADALEALREIAAANSHFDACGGSAGGSLPRHRLKKNPPWA
jgi:VWFA-related protein